MVLFNFRFFDRRRDPREGEKGPGYPIMRVAGFSSSFLNSCRKRPACPPSRRKIRPWRTEYGSETLSVPAVTKDGERISIEFTINLLRDTSGKVLGPVAVVRDVTARWIREKELRRKLAFLDAGQTAA